MTPPLPATARLVVERGMSNVTLRSKAGLGSLYVVSPTTDKGPTVETEGNVLYMRFPRGWPWKKVVSEVTLSEDTVWDIEVRGGLSDIRCELEGLRLTSFAILGGASNVELALGRPTGTCTVSLSGGASHFVVRRPKDVGVRLAIRGGASRVALDDSFFGAVGGKLRMESSHYGDTKDHYEVEIGGGVSHLKIGS